MFTCCLLFTSVASAGHPLVPTPNPGEPIFPDGTPASLQGGLVIIRQGDTIINSLGGGLLPRRVRIRTCTPDGAVVTRFLMPPASHFHCPPPIPGVAPALISVAVPDNDGLIYIDDQLVSSDGTLRSLQSPPLPPGISYPLHLRCAFKSGDNLLIEEKQVLIQAGESISVSFDGKKAVSVPLPREPQMLPPPHELKK
jgi:uncharacterized protein (TIGR03000 family)